MNKSRRWEGAFVSLNYERSCHSLSMRSRYHSLCGRAPTHTSFVYLWQPLAATKVQLLYCSPNINEFEKWKRDVGSERQHDQAVAGYFDRELLRVLDFVELL